MASNLCRTLASILILMLMAGYAVGKNSFYRFSSKAVENVPDIVQRANSASFNDRIGVLEQLLRRLESDALSYELSYDLLPEDYCNAVRSVLEGGLFAIDDSKKVRDVLEKTRYLAAEFKLTALLPGVVKFLEYDDPIVQIQALMILEQLEARQYAKEIAKAVSSPDRDVSWPALQILVKFNTKEAVPGLISCLKENNFSRQRFAVEALARIGDRSAIPHLIPLLKTKLNSWALDALVSLDAQEAVPYIKELYRPGELNANIVLTSLAYFGNEQAISDIIAEMTDEKMPRGETFLKELLKIKARAVIPALISALEDEKAIGGKSDRGPNIVHQMMITLAKLKANEAIPVLRRYLTPQSGSSSLDSFLTESAVEGLGILKAKEVIPELLRMLDSSDYSKWSEATMALARIGEPSTVEKVISALRKRKANAHHVRVLGQLAHVSDPNTYDALSVVKLSRLESLPIEAYLNQLSEKCGVKITLSGSISLPEEKRHRTVVGQSGHTGLSALHFAVRVLNYSAYKNTIFVDNGVVHVVTIEEAYNLWDNWLAEHKKNHPSRLTRLSAACSE